MSKRNISIKATTMILLLIIVISCFVVPVNASARWQPIHTENGPMGIWKIVVSPLHYGYASPTHGYQTHQNFVLYAFGKEVMNLHVYVDPTNSNCVCGWESHTNTFKRYCSEDLRNAAESVLIAIKDVYKEVVGWVQWATIGAAVTDMINQIIQWIRDNYHWIIRFI